MAIVDWGRLRRAFFDWDIFRDQFPEIVTRGAWHALVFTVLGFAIAFGLAVVLALMRLSQIGPYRWFAIAWVELWRGLPAITTIYIIGFVVPLTLDTRVPGIYGPGSVALGIVYSAYMAETIRAGVEAVPRGQSEAARSLGMSAVTTTQSIVLPQAFRIIVPPMTNEVISLFKDTALLYILGTTAATIEITTFARDGIRETFNATPIVAAALVYLAITIPLTRLAGLLERRNRRAR